MRYVPRVTLGEDRGWQRSPTPDGRISAALRACSAAFLFQGIAIASVFTTVPTVQAHFDLSTNLTNLILLSVIICAGVGSFGGAFAVGQVGSRATLRACFVLFAAGLLMVGWAPSVGPAWVGYLVFGLAIGAVDVTLNARGTAVEVAIGRSVFASFYAYWSAGGIISALVTSGLTSLGSPLSVVMSVQAGLLLVMLAVRQTEPPTSDPTPGQVTVSAVELPDGLPRGTWRALLPLCLALLVIYYVDTAVTAWSGIYLRDALASPLAAAPLAYAAYQGGMLLGRSYADGPIRRFGPETVARATAIFTALSLLGLAIAPTWWIAIAAAGLAGLGVAALVPLSLAAAGRLVPDSVEAVLARLVAFNYGGILLGSAVVGSLGGAEHFRLAYLSAAVAILLPLAIANHFNPRGTKPGEFSGKAPRR